MTGQEKTPALRAATRFWKLLGCPEEFRCSAADWEPRMKDVLEDSALDLPEFMEFLDWVLTLNEYSARYLRIASNPMASLRKNLPSLLKRYHANKAALAARERSQTKAKPTPKYREDKIW
jgi:hypothetical protein